MAFFSFGSEKEKLMLLYSLKRAGIPLSKEQLTAIAFEHGLENYLDLSEHLFALEDKAYIAFVPAFNLQTIALTSLGREAVALFSSNLPKSLRDSIDDYISVHLDDFRRENTAQVQTRTLTDGNYTTSLALVENGNAFFELRIKLPGAKYANEAMRRWDSISQKLYLDTLLALTGEQENGNALTENADDSPAASEQVESDNTI